MPVGFCEYRSKTTAVDGLYVPTSVLNGKETSCGERLGAALGTDVEGRETKRDGDMVGLRVLAGMIRVGEIVGEMMV